MREIEILKQKLAGWPMYLKWLFLAIGINKFEA